MKALVQRVTEATVSVADERVATIGGGLVVFLGVEPEDNADDAARLAAKTAALRIFADADRPMNRSVVDVDGEVLVVSQFTLAADTSRGNRPGFSAAAAPEQAERLYEAFVDGLRQHHPRIATGVFGADMQVALINDGPVTFLLER